MSSTVEQLAKRGLCAPPSDVRSNTMYETIVGSVAYGVADEFSDYDINGFYIPKADQLFPHLRGHLLGFDPNPTAPKAYQQHHIWDSEAGGREYDLTLYSITIYFKLCMDNNPNMVSTLYTPRSCILHSTAVSEMVRGARNLFLHKQCWPKYKGYAYQQLHKMKGKRPEEGSKRYAIREKYGFDVKFAYHLVRLLLEAEMIMTEHRIDIQRHQEHLKSIRHGEISEDEIIKWAADKELQLDRAFENSTLRAKPAYEGIKQLLFDCLETHYGNLEALTTSRIASVGHSDILRQIKDLCGKAV